MSTLFEELRITYREEDGLFYPNITMGEGDEQIVTGNTGIFLFTLIILGQVKKAGG